MLRAMFLQLRLKPKFHSNKKTFILLFSMYLLNMTKMAGIVLGPCGYSRTGQNRSLGRGAYILMSEMIPQTTCKHAKYQGRDIIEYQ